MLVVAKSVQEIKYWITLWRGLIRGSGVITRGQVYAVVDNMLQNLAIERIAVNSALCMRDRTKI